jgi:flavin reductase (DIM6/NTAB) family NADH-FMN oxidoreductase RutF
MLFDMEALSPANTYKLLVATIVPRPIAWVTSLDESGAVNAAPFSFFNAMSGAPPVVCIGIGPRDEGDAKDTAHNIRRTGQFVVNLVNEEAAPQMNVSAIEFDKAIDELREAGLTPVPSTKVRPPRIAESPVNMECERLVMLDVGIERTIAVGRVVAMHVRDDAVLDPARCYIDTPKLHLIGRMHGRGWYARTTDRFEMPRIDVAEWPSRR